MEELITYQIKDGVRLHFIPTDKFKTTTLSVYIRRPLKKEEAALNALVPFVLRRGSIKHPDSRSLAVYLEELLGAEFECSVRKKGESQILCLNFRTIADRYFENGEEIFEKLADLMRSIVFEPILENGVFKSDYVEQEKQMLSMFIMGMFNDKREYARQRCFEEMCKNEAFGVYEYGSLDEVEKITPQILYDHYRQIISTSPIDIFITGESDREKMAGKLTTFWAGNAQKVVQVPKTVVVKDVFKVKDIQDKEKVNQGKLSMGFRTGIDGQSPLVFAQMIFNSVFGSTPSSKLFNNVREKLSLAYYASSSIEKYKGIMTVDCGIEFEKFNAAKDEIVKQLDLVRSGEITNHEFEAALLSTINAIRSIKDSAFVMEDLYLGQLIENKVISPDDMIRKVREVTKEQVAQVAQGMKLDTVYFLKGDDAS